MGTNLAVRRRSCAWGRTTFRRTCGPVTQTRRERPCLSGLDFQHLRAAGVGPSLSAPATPHRPCSTTAQVAMGPTRDCDHFVGRVGNPSYVWHEGQGRLCTGSGDSVLIVLVESFPCPQCGHGSELHERHSSPTRWASSSRPWRSSVQMRCTHWDAKSSGAARGQSRCINRCGGRSRASLSENAQAARATRPRLPPSARSLPPPGLISARAASPLRV